MFEENFNYIIVLFATLLLLTAYFVNNVYIFFSFTLYLADTRVGRGNLVLKHSDPYFLPNFERRNSTLRFALTFVRRYENIKYFIRVVIELTTIYCHLCATTDILTDKYMFIIYTDIQKNTLLLKNQMVNLNYPRTKYVFFKTVIIHILKHQSEV